MSLESRGVRGVRIRKVMKKFCIIGILSLSVNLVFFGMASAVPGTEGLQPMAQSQAFQDFLKKPVNNFSKLVCVLNYMRTVPFMVQYDGIDYTAEAAYPFGLVYLMTNYHNEDPEHWAKKHCYRSLFSNAVILFKFQDGSSRPARDVILEKYRELEAAQRKRASKI